jgi:hypothetical protein
MIVPDHQGADYTVVLSWFHRRLKPRTYFEIGTLDGLSLGIADCASIGVDPELRIADGRTICNKPECHLYRATSDSFFDRYNPAAVLGRPIDLAFLDGMHHCEFLLRDFMNIEKHCRKDSVVLLHDCLPVEAGMTARDRAESRPLAPNHQGWWTGDVWRTALALKRYRPDLTIKAFDAPPTGLIAVTGLDPSSRLLGSIYADLIAASFAWNYNPFALFVELGVQSTAAIEADGALEALFPPFPDR